MVRILGKWSGETPLRGDMMTGDGVRQDAGGPCLRQICTSELLTSGNQLRTKFSRSVFFKNFKHGC